MNFLEEHMFIAIALILLGIFGLAFAIVVPVDYSSCISSYSAYNPSWGFISGCRIEWEGKLTPVDMIKNITVAK